MHIENRTGAEIPRKSRGRDRAERPSTAYEGAPQNRRH